MTVYEPTVEGRELPLADDGRSDSGAAFRFTSNIVGPFYFIADLACLLIAAPITLVIYEFIFRQRIIPEVHFLALMVMVLSFCFVRASKRAYERSLLHIGESDDGVVLDATVCVFLTAAIIWQIGEIDDYSRGVSILYLLVVSATLTASRPLLASALRGMARSGRIAQRIAFYGADRPSIELIRGLVATSLPHLRFVGVADDRPIEDDYGDLPLIGGFDELAELARRGLVDQVLIHVPDLNAVRLKEIVDGLSQVSVDVSVIPPQAVMFAPEYRVNLLGYMPVLTLWQRPFRDINQFLKRFEDLVVGVVALILVSPIMALTALAIRLTSKGPVLFVQPRVGFNNEVIQVMKFRSMFVDRLDLKGLKTTTRNDPRVTPVGRVIRRLSIDELPQLFNVVRGDMSVVGPRPHATHMKVGDRFYVDAVRGYAGRHRVKPGLTGLAQVRGLRGEIRTVERARRRVELDKAYIEQWSIWLDFKIMLMTVRAVIADSDAY